MRGSRRSDRGRGTIIARLLSEARSNDGDAAGLCAEAVRRPVRRVLPVDVAGVGADADHGDAAVGVPPLRHALRQIRVGSE